MLDDMPVSKKIMYCQNCWVPYDVEKDMCPRCKGTHCGKLFEEMEPEEREMAQKRAKISMSGITQVFLVYFLIFAILKINNTLTFTLSLWPIKFHIADFIIPIRLMVIASFIMTIVTHNSGNYSKFKTWRLAAAVFFVLALVIMIGIYALELFGYI